MYLPCRLVMTLRLSATSCVAFDFVEFGDYAKRE
jgi:hypothetical protein